MSETKINSSLSSKFKKTQVNSVQKLPDITGHTLGKFYVDSRLDIVSGEADIYICSGSAGHSGKRFLLKYYRRRNAIKPDVLKKLKGVNSPFVAPVEGFGEYQGHQYVVRPYYEMSALSELLAEGTRFSEEELKKIIIPSIIEGLKAVHDTGILHKDLKPANLIPDDAGEHIVLIDFGISTDTGKNTFVVTQTGMTPLYAAPEAMQGIFHRETDYYALGITIFELFTGFTPFQNPELSPEEVARLASISKIEFPEGFPEDLKKLVLGLTYKDISHRNEKDNPNRRWGYDEVRKWLDGEDVPVVGERDASGLNQKFLPYSFGGVKYQTLESLARAMLKDPEGGIKEIGRGIPAHHFSLFAPSAEKLCREAEELLQRNLDAESNRKVFYRLMYSLAPDLKTFFCCGREFANLKELGEAAIDAAVSDDARFARELRLLQRTFLDFYAGTILKSDAAGNLLTSVLQVSKEQYSDIQIAWILGYALSGKKNIRIGEKAFTCPSELLEYLKKLENEQGFADYIKYIEEHRQDLEFFATVFPEAKSRETLTHMLEDLNQATIFGNGELRFKNAKSFDDYVAKLLRDKQTYLLRHILNSYDAALKEVSEDVWQSSSYENLRKTVSSFVVFEEYLFASVQDLKIHLEQLLKEHRDTPEFYRNFVSYHNSALTKLERVPSISDVIGRFRSYASIDAENQQDIVVNGVVYPKFKMRVLKEGIAAGECVKFGSYPQNDNAKAPIEWLVLDVIGNEALLLTRYGLDWQTFGHSSTWKGSFLREWLNTEFLKVAFSEDDLQRIKLSVVDDTKKIFTFTGGNNTQDRIFCLSREEVEQYKNVLERRCKMIIYADKRGRSRHIPDKDDCYQCVGWWLRSSPNSNWWGPHALIVDEFSCPKVIVVESTKGNIVRPALWAKL